MMVDIYADGADLPTIRALAESPLVKGFTTNPSLVRKAGITDYEAFAREALSAARGKPVSIEVLADDLDEMERQARIIAGWGDNAAVKIPVTTTTGASCGELITRLSYRGVTVNVTALMTLAQVQRVALALNPDAPAYVSLFVGRIADTGLDPLPMVQYALCILSQAAPKAKLIWASPREALNIYDADRLGCHVITCTPDLIAKLTLKGKDLTEYSRETVAGFHRDALAAGYTL